MGDEQHCNWMNWNPFYLLIVGVVLFASALPLGADEKGSNARTNEPAQPVELPGVHNAFRASARVYSGSQPESNEAFAAIAQLGVKTIVSVDGSKPDVEAARKHGLRYVHLPIGYDGVPTNRIAELARLTAEMSGPFFVHCHHGQHRGPAAVAVMCEASEGWTADQAVTWLREAGTSTDYPGLYRAAEQFRPPTRAQLEAVRELPEVAQTSSLVEAMVAIDAHFDRLKQSQKAGWKAPPGHADISPRHEATMLWEQFREVARTDDTAKRNDDYRTKLAETEQTADSLRKLLRESSDHAVIDAAFKRVGQNCSACHQKYRNE
ncbi:MAG TPA: cytochrome c [Verrucomicrobiae bacterium]|nr:cytochrome c [Verrucomicrobiae bacterium]